MMNNNREKELILSSYKADYYIHNGIFVKDNRDYWVNVTNWKCEELEDWLNKCFT